MPGGGTLFTAKCPVPGWNSLWIKCPEFFWGDACSWNWLEHNILSSFATVLSAQCYVKTRLSNTIFLELKRRAFIDHKTVTKAIKPFALSFFFNRSDSFRDLFYAVLLSWKSYFYLKIWQLIILYIGRMDCGAAGRPFDNHSRNEGEGICQCSQGKDSHIIPFDAAFIRGRRLIE